jgi:hypothetical protein
LGKGPKKEALNLLCRLAQDGALPRRAFKLLRSQAADRANVAVSGCVAPRELAQITLLALAEWLPVHDLLPVYSARYHERPGDDWLQYIIGRPDTPIQLMRRVARELSTTRDAHGAWVTLARSSVAVRDRGIRDLIISRGPADAIEILMEKAAPDEWPRAVRELICRNNDIFARTALFRLLKGADQAELMTVQEKDWKALMLEDPDPFLPQLMCLALIPSARQSPSVRDALLKGTCPEALYYWCINAEHDDTREVFRALSAGSPAKAIEALHDSPSLESALKPEDLQPLLNSDDVEAKIAILEVLART